MPALREDQDYNILKHTLMGEEKFALKTIGVFFGTLIISIIIIFACCFLVGEKPEIFFVLWPSAITAFCCTAGWCVIVDK